jgi:hypothetical protein
LWNLTAGVAGKADSKLEFAHKLMFARKMQENRPRCNGPEKGEKGAVKDESSDFGLLRHGRTSADPRGFAGLRIADLGFGQKARPPPSIAVRQK